MKDDTWLAVVLFVLPVFGLLIYRAGVGQENERIYNQCLDRNSAMIYSDAVVKCKEIVE